MAERAEVASKSSKKRMLTKDRICNKLPKTCFSFAKEDKAAVAHSAGIQTDHKIEDAMGLDLSELSASGLDPDALSSFPKLRRLTLKNNHIVSLSPLPSTLSYLDVSHNPELSSLSFLRGLRSLTTLILSECPALGQILNLQGEDFKDCVQLKVLVVDRCDLRGTLTLESTPFVSKVTTLICSHNDLKKIDLKNAPSLTKLSASNNPELKAVKNVPNATIAELRLASCPKLESLDFLNKKQRKLALLDLGSSPLVREWDDLKEVLCTASLLTLNLKATPLRDSFQDDKSEYERKCLNKLKCTKLRSLDYAKITMKLAASMVKEGDDEGDEELEDESSEGEDFTIVESVKEMTTLPKEEDNEESEQEEQERERAKKKLKKDDGLFKGESSAW